MNTDKTDHFVLDHATIWIGDGQTLQGHVVVAKGCINAVELGRYKGDLPCVDCHGMALAPGLIDIMFGGGFGRSLVHDDPIEIAGMYLRRGVTTFQYAVGTFSDTDRARLIENVRKGMTANQPGISALAGVYFEGPFYDPVSIGANNAALVWAASRENASRVIDECGDIIKMINVSPGIEGDGTVIKMFSDAGIAVTMAHSAANAERVVKCIEAGTSQLGHAWNNRTAAPMVEPGVYIPTLEHVALQDERVKFLHLICDGVHLHPTLIRLAMHCRGIDAICVVSDTINLAGMADGSFTFDSGLRASKIGDVARLESGGLAGSALLLPEHFRFFVEATGLPGHEAIRAVTHNPAESLGLGSQIGLIRRGRRADLVCFDESLHVRRIWKEGCEIKPHPDIGHDTIGTHCDRYFDIP